MPEFIIEPPPRIFPAVINCLAIPPASDIKHQMNPTRREKLLAAFVAASALGLLIWSGINQQSPEQTANFNSRNDRRAGQHPNPRDATDRKRSSVEGSETDPHSHILGLFDEFIERDDYTGLIRYARTLTGINGLDIWNYTESKALPESSKRNLFVEAVRLLLEAHSPTEVFDHVISNLGDGDTKIAILRMLCTNREVGLNDYITFSSTMTQEEQLSTTASIAFNLGQNPDLNIEDCRRIVNSLPHGEAVIIEILSQIPFLKTSDQTSATDLVSKSIKLSQELLQRGELELASLDKIYLSLSQKLPSHTFLSIKEEGLYDSLGMETKSLLMARYAKHDPLAYLDLAVSEPSSNMDLGTGLAFLIASDTTAGTRWFESNHSKLTPKVHSQYSSYLSRHSIANGNVTEAWQYIERISDPEIKKQAEGQVWSKEKDLVIHAVKTDPTRTLSELVSGASHHASYWIEEAMHTWIQNDPAQAESWYRKNWESLPPAKSQFVAAAYAKNALGLGDTATARQWSNLIQDPKTRERIEASIIKADAGIDP